VNATNPIGGLLDSTDGARGNMPYAVRLRDQISHLDLFATAGATKPLKVLNNPHRRKSMTVDFVMSEDVHRPFATILLVMLVITSVVLFQTEDCLAAEQVTITGPGGKPLSIKLPDFMRPKITGPDGKQYQQEGQVVGITDSGMQVPVSVFIGGLPFSCSPLNVRGKMETGWTIKIIGADKDLLLPAKDSGVPLYNSLSPTGVVKSELFTHALNVTWEFTKSGIVFLVDGIQYTSEKDGARIAFTDGGVIVEGFRIAPAEKKDPAKRVIFGDGA
jgi:hypothetical protein